MPQPQESLLRNVETLKNIMVAYATGSKPDEETYQALRRSLVRDPVVAGRLPRFVHTCRSLREFWGVIKEASDTYAGRRAFLAEAFDPLLITLKRQDSIPADATTDQILSKVNSDEIHAVWQRALDRRSADPEGAITLARTLLEAVCKHILDNLREEYDDKADLPKLYGLVASKLNLSPSQHTEQIFRQILGGCHSVVEGLGALRSKLGDAHAHGKRGVKPASRHAELAVNLAGTAATFLVATWEARKESTRPN